MAFYDPSCRLLSCVRGCLPGWFKQGKAEQRKPRANPGSISVSPQYFYILKLVQNGKDKTIHVAFIFSAVRSFINGYTNSLCLSTYPVKRYAAMLPDERHPLPRLTRRRVGCASLQPFFLSIGESPLHGAALASLLATSARSDLQRLQLARLHYINMVWHLLSQIPNMLRRRLPHWNSCAPLAFLLPFNPQAFPGSIAQLGDVRRYLHIGNDRYAYTLPSLHFLLCETNIRTLT